MQSKKEDLTYCPSCQSGRPLSTWSVINVSSGSGHASMTVEVYDPESKRRFNKGSISLYACPVCGTVVFKGR
jgi:hypothetical protein